MRSLRRPVAALLAAIAATAGAASAEAACTRLAFSVNDYGKDGPTKDAKQLLDGYVAKWAAERGIKGYTIGKKDVTCELFLDFIVFDEHTCKAEATVCWNGPPAKDQPAASASKAAPKSEKPKSAAPAATPAKAADAGKS